MDKWGLKGHFAGMLAYAIFGLNIIVTKDIMATETVSPLALFSMRSIGAGVLFWLASLFKRKEKVSLRDHMLIVGAAFTGFFLTQISFLIAISDITPMDCAVMTSLSPIYTMFIAAIAIKEPITLKKTGGVLLSLAGVLFLIYNSVTTSGGVTETKPIGVFFMFLNGFCFSIYLGVFKPVIMRYSVITFMKWIFLYSSLMSLPFTGAELVSLNYLSFEYKFVAEILFAIVFSTFITYYLVPVAQKALRPTLVSMYSYMQPIVATSVSIYIGMDTLGWKKVLAAVAVFAGVLIVNYSRAARQIK